MKLSNRIIFVIILVILTTFVFIKMFSSRAEYILLDYASFKSTNIISSQINSSINKVLYENNYDNIIKEYKDSEGNIVNVDFDNLIVNRLLYLITDNLLNNDYISSNDSVYYVPLGIMYNTPILNNLGPKIPFKIDIIRSVNNDTKINIKEYGINSSMIELVINIGMKIEVIMPFKSKMISINKSIILDSKIIQGKVPDYYGGIISSSLK